MTAVPFRSVRAAARRASVALVVPAVALAACGSSSPSDQITSLLNNAASDPASSCDHFTQRELNAHFGGNVNTCKTAAAKAGPDKNFKVTSVKVNGNNAVATATTNGGTRTFILVNQGGDWKIDRVGVG